MIKKTDILVSWFQSSVLIFILWFMIQVYRFLLSWKVFLLLPILDLSLLCSLYLIFLRHRWGHCWWRLEVLAFYIIIKTVSNYSLWRLYNLSCDVSPSYLKANSSSEELSILALLDPNEEKFSLMWCDL